MPPKAEFASLMYKTNTVKKIPVARLINPLSRGQINIKVFDAPNNNSANGSPDRNQNTSLAVG